MKQKGGAILIGMSHTGKENVDRVIQALIGNGIKRGDLVAVEKSPDDLKRLKKEIEEGRVSELIKLFTRGIRSVEEQIKSCKSSDELKRLQPLKDELKSALNDKIFEYKFYNFLFSKGCKILTLDSNAKLKKMQSMNAYSWKEKLAETPIKVSRKQKLIGSFLTVPIREAYFRKRLQGTVPKFVVVGVGHLSAVKRMLPYEKALDLSDANLAKRATRRIKADFIRTQYKAIKIWKKAKRRVAPRRKP